MLRATPQGARARIDRGREGAIVCTAPGACTVRGSGVAWTTRIVPDGDTSYTAEGFAAYDDALTLALESIRRRDVVPGAIKVATTSVGGDSGFARPLAGARDIDKALAEGNASTPPRTHSDRQTRQ